MTIRDEVQRRFIIECRRDWHGDPDPNIARSRLRLFLTGNRKQDEVAYEESMSNGRKGLLALIEKYADKYLLDIDHDSDVGTCVDIRDMVEHSDDPDDPNIRHESRVLADLSFCTHKLDSTNSEHAAGKGNNALIRTIKDNFVGFVKTEVVTHHDPDNSYRTALWELRTKKPADASQVARYALQKPLPTGLRSRVTEMKCRRLKDGRLVCMQHRVKGKFEMVLKVLHQVDKWERNPLIDGKPWDPLAVPDRSGIRFLVPDVAEAFQFADELRTFLKDRGIVCTAIEENIRNGGKVDGSNTHSSRWFRAIKFNAEEEHSSHEVQILTFRDYFSSRYALGEENHELYKLSRCLDFYFPLFWPVNLYGVNWADDSIRRELIEQKVSRLNWRVDRNR